MPVEKPTRFHRLSMPFYSQAQMAHPVGAARELLHYGTGAISARCKSAAETSGDTATRPNI
jgi:hypothetical protein